MRKKRKKQTDRRTKRQRNREPILCKKKKETSLLCACIAAILLISPPCAVFCSGLSKMVKRLASNPKIHQAIQNFVEEGDNLFVRDLTKLVWDRVRWTNRQSD